MPFSSARAVVFDLDGTLYRGSAPVDGAAALLELLADQGREIFFCSNNSTRTREGISAKLNALKLPAAPERVYSAAYGAARYLGENGLSEVYCFGSAGLKEELARAGVGTVSAPEEASVLLIGLDPELSYRGIDRLLPLRGKKCRLVACNRDKYFPVEDGRLQLGCGFVATMVEEALERKVDYTVGKPNCYLLDLLTREQGLAMEEVVMVGDSLEYDIAMAREAGCRSVYLSWGEEAADVPHVRSLHELRSLFS